MAQSGTVSGQVFDENGEPLPGVVVFYDGTQTSTVTDANGRYTIPAKKGSSLTFNCFGMKDEVVRIEGQSKLDVTLVSADYRLDEAVVIGYGKQLRRDLTGSVSSMKAEDLQKTGSNNALGALQGHVAGLNITSQNGEPGAGFQIRIRGNNSINAGSTPLFVIDGVQMDISSSEIASSTTTGTGTYDPLSFLNPSDIESVEVLKDASATAIYGAQGANGVIIITTKSGRNADHTVVNLDATLGIQEVPRHIDMLNKQQYVNYRFGRSDYGWAHYGIDTDGDGEADCPLDATSYEEYDWQKLMFRKALTQNYNISASGRVGKGTQFFASAGYLDQQGLVINNTYKRYNGRLKLDHRIGKRVKIGANVTFSRGITDGAVASGGGSLGNSGLIQLIFLERPLNLISESDTEYQNGWRSLTTMFTDETSRRTIYDRLAGNAYIDWNITDHLLLHAGASGTLSNSDLKEFYTKYSRWGQVRNGYGSLTEVSTYNYSANVYLNWDRNFGKHHVDMMGGTELSKYNTDQVNISSYNYNEWSTGAFDIGKGGIINNPSQSTGQSTRISGFGRVNYNFNSRYYLTANLRVDASSKFFKKNRVGVFPSASFAWRISEEPWMAGAKGKWLDNLKLRLSAGASGNDRVSTYAALATLSKNYYANLGTEIMGMAPNTSANPKLRWETTYQYDLGIDLMALKERIDLSVDAYYKDTRNMLYKAILSAQAGFTEQWQNIGRVSNWGVEISLTTHNISHRDFSWNTSFTFDLTRNKIIDIGGVEYTSINMSNGTFNTDISRIIAGQPIGVGYGYVWDGNYQLTDFIIKDKAGNDFTSHPEIVSLGNMKNFIFTLKDDVPSINSVNVEPGDRKYKDLDGDNVITEDDRKVISNSNPKFTAGLQNNFSYKNFELSFFLEGVFGREILNEFKCRSESGTSSSIFNNLRKDFYEGHWTPENGSNVYARIMNKTSGWVSTYYVEDASFLRIKNISFSYTIPEKAFKKAKITALKFSFNVDNAYVFTKYSGMDPDVSSSNALFTGFDRMSYPKARVYSLGINATF